MLIKVIIGSLAASIGTWILVDWRDRRMASRRAQAMRRLGPWRVCECCGGMGWHDRHKAASQWLRCQQCKGWGFYRYLGRAQ